MILGLVQIPAGIWALLSVLGSLGVLGGTSIAKGRAEKRFTKKQARTGRRQAAREGQRRRVLAAKEKHAKFSERDLFGTRSDEMQSLQALLQAMAYGGGQGGMPHELLGDALDGESLDSDNAAQMLAAMGGDAGNQQVDPRRVAMSSHVPRGPMTSVFSQRPNPNDIDLMEALTGAR